MLFMFSHHSFRFITGNISLLEYFFPSDDHFTNFKHLKFFNLADKESKRKETCHLLVHFSNSYNRQDQSNQELGISNLIQVSHMNRSDPILWANSLSRHELQEAAMGMRKSSLVPQCSPKPQPRFYVHYPQYTEDC